MVQEKHGQVVVVGGGPAGVCAAVAAARGGARTVLVQSRAVLGGNSSSEIRVWTRGATGAGNLFAEEMGVWGDFKLRNLYTNSDGNPVLWDEVLLDLVLKEPLLELCLNTYVDRVELEGGKVAAVFGRNLLGDGYYRITGDIFIDCTGDGTLGAAAGVPFHLGKEGRAEYGESLAPQEPEAATQGSSLLFYVKKADHRVKFIPPDYAYDMDYMETLLNNGARIVSENYGGSDYWWVEYGGHLNGALNEMQEVTLRLKKLIMGVWNYIKNSGKFDADYHTLEWVGNYPGKRETRRMITDYVLSQDGVETPSTFYDGAFYGGWYIDFHPSDGVKSVEDGCIQIPVSPYQVPLRTLYNSAVPNLLFAGRNIGTTHVAFASTRIMNTCALSGQAAGQLAAWCARAGVGTDRVDETAAAQVQLELRRNDAFLPGTLVRDSADLACEASLSVSGSFDGGCGMPTGALPLRKGRFFTLPVRAGQDRAEALLDTPDDAVLRGAWYASPLPSRLLPGTPLGSAELPVAAGRIWTPLPLPPIDADCFLTFVCGEDSTASLCTEAEQRTGFLCGRQDGSDYAYPCIRGDYRHLYAPSALTSGYNRPYGSPNVWISDRLPAVVELNWEKTQILTQVTLTFDPDLSREIPSSRAEKWADSHIFTPRPGMPPELVRAFTLELRDAAGQWRTVHTEGKNWRRRYPILLDRPTGVAALRLTVTATYGSPYARVFEIVAANHLTHDRKDETT